MVEGYVIDIYEEPASLKMGGRVVTFAAALYDDKMNRVAEFYTKEHAEAFMHYINGLEDDLK